LKYPGQESNNPHQTRGKVPSVNGATHKAAHGGDERLAAIVTAWPNLPETVKDELARLASAAAAGG
jgi:hypothetical protein